MALSYSLLLSSALASIALWKKALTMPGTVLAWSMCIVITAVGGLQAFVMLSATFLLTVIVDKAVGSRTDPFHVRRKSGKRDAVRVMCNVGTGTLAMLCMLASGKASFITVYAAVMAESLADSLASKIGPLSKRKPVDICTMKPVDTGLSGGITLLGSLSEVAGAAVIAGIAAIFGNNLKSLLIILAAGFAGAMFDSILGSLVQAKFICPRCGRITEKEMHCGIKTECISGYGFINNDLVNLLSNLFAFVAALLAAALL